MGKFYVVNFRVDPYEDVQSMLTSARTISGAVDKVIIAFMERGIVIRPEGAYLDPDQRTVGRRVGVPPRKRGPKPKRKEA